VSGEIDRKDLASDANLGSVRDQNIDAASVAA
jgi:hypothetical protein